MERGVGFDEEDEDGFGSVVMGNVMGSASSALALCSRIANARNCSNSCMPRSRVIASSVYPWRRVMR